MLMPGCKAKISIWITWSFYDIYLALDKLWLPSWTPQPRSLFCFFMDSFHYRCPNSHNLKVLEDIQCLQHQLQDQYDELSICELTDGLLQLLGWYLYCGDGNLLFIHGDPRKHILTLCVYMQPYIYFSFIYHDATHTFSYSYNYVYIYWLSLGAIEAAISISVSNLPVCNKPIHGLQHWVLVPSPLTIYWSNSLFWARFLSLE